MNRGKPLLSLALSGIPTTESCSVALPPGRGDRVMSLSDTEYYRMRATEERQKALQSSNRDVAAIHEELARQYQALIDQVELRPTLGIETATRLRA